MRVRPRVRGDDGAIAILVAILSVVLFGLAAIVVDLGMVRIVAADTQSAADAAALAAATALYDTTASTTAVSTPDFAAAWTAAKSSGLSNGIPIASWGGCTAPVRAGWIRAGSRTSCITFDSLTRPRRVQVVTPSQRVTAAFGGVFGYSGSDVSRLAQAQARDRKIQDCSLCVMGLLDVQDDSEVSVQGDGSLVAQRGNAEPPDAAVSVIGDGSLAFAEFPPTPDPSNDVWSPEPEQSDPQDPFAALPAADVSGVPAPELITRCDVATGLVVDVALVYSTLVIDGPCTVGAGTLVVTRTLRILGGARLTGSGTTIYLSCHIADGAEDCSGSLSLRGRIRVLTGGRLDLEGGKLGDGRHLGVVCARGNPRESRITGDVVLLDSSIACGRNTWRVEDGQLGVTDGLASLGGLTVSSSGQVDLDATGLGSGPGPFRLALVK